MIVVCGTKRSGTSMWMQILTAAGFPALGEAMPPGFAGLESANPGGFYESRLRSGIYFRTNPDPLTGVYLQPAATRDHAVKVFVPGVIRSDRAHLDRVLFTIRDWRSYVSSLARMHQIEDDRLLQRHVRGALSDEALGKAQAEMARRRGELPAVIEWWMEIYSFLRDASTREYDYFITSYASLMDSPEQRVAEVMGWLGTGDPVAGAAAVRADFRTQTGEEIDVSAWLDADQVAVMDELYACLHARATLTVALVERMNALQEALAPRWKASARRIDGMV